MGLVAATVALALAPALAGCSSGGSKNGAGPKATPSQSLSTGPSGGSGTATATPGPGGTVSASPTPGPGSGTTGTAPQPSAGGSVPAPAPSASGPSSTATLVTVTRSGGMKGQTSGLVIKGDGSFLRLDSQSKAVSGDKLSAAALAKLRTALREADFAHLPRISMPDKPVADAFTYAFAYGGYEVAAAQTTLPPALSKVLDALPPFDPR
ncbi:hypothetical protein ACFXDJ_29320 [Streptomyces sp. NPDC059443]|uniref:hypothetical protein n=1 Tax=unclassified Streptomyces TaxID=2593676 RepID=UPI003698DFB2